MWKITLLLFLTVFGSPTLSGAVSLGQAMAKELITAPETITIGGKSLLIEAHLWRDFMPLSPPGGRPLIASITLKTADGTNLPKGIEVVSVWVFNGEAVWFSPQNKFTTQRDDPTAINLVIRDGPKWGPGINVDVIVELKDAENRSFLLRVSRQPILRTD